MIRRSPTRIELKLDDLQEFERLKEKLMEKKKEDETKKQGKTREERIGYKCEGVKRKRSEEEEGPGPSQKLRKQEAVKKRKVKLKNDKENGLGKLQNIFTVQAEPKRIVLSPKKVDDNAIAIKSPEKAIKALDYDICDFAFDEPMLEEKSDDFWHLMKSELTLDIPTRCDVLRCMLTNQPQCELIVLVRAEGSEKKSVCRLRDMWMFLPLHSDDKVTIKAGNIDGEWIVSSKVGYVILFPDHMMPVTTLVGGMYCLRRGVLSNMFKNIGSSGKQMLIGRLVHDVLQESLQKDLTTEEEINKVLENTLNSHSYLRELYINNLKMEDAFLEALVFVPKILSFINTYIKGTSPADGVNFKGLIKEIVDIEELVTSAKMGLQGRVDLTVKVQIGNHKKVMPLELKTGRASFSDEHKIQVIVYTLLLDDLIRNVDSGLLLYLKDNRMEEIKPEVGQVRNLIMLRNEFVKYIKEGTGECLPEPIRSSSCMRCSYSRICTSYLKHSGLDNLSANHPIRNMDFPDLTQAHIEYFYSWMRMIITECKSQDIVIDDLILEGDPVETAGEFRYVFFGRIRNLQKGQIVKISASERKLSQGRVVDFTDESCTVVLNKNIGQSGEKYKIETSRRSLINMNLTTLAVFLEKEYLHLRELIIDRVPPKCDAKITKRILTDECLSILKPLNREQQSAIFKTIACSDFLLIKGPPGTGKTETIVALIKLLQLQKQSVLITGHTHSSIDNILLKLNGIEYIRFGALSSVNPKVHHRCFSFLIDQCKTMDDIKKLYDCGVMASTCLGIDLDMLQIKKFDVCIVDESSQVMQIEAIRALLFCKKFVLIGDTNQLPPVVTSMEAKNLGMDVSIFERLETKEATAVLTQQYRMNKVLNDLANDLTYNGELFCGNDDVAKATLKLSNPPKCEEIMEILSPDIGMSVVFVSTSDFFDNATAASTTNPIEAGIISLLVKELVNNGIQEKDIGVITPFCNQVKLLKSKVNIGVDVSTVDQYQGRDKNVVLFSCAKRLEKESISDVSTHILNDKRRLNVAITRAKVKLIIVGCINSMTAYSPFKKLISCLKSRQIIRLRKDSKNIFMA